jgi:tRNA-splicing ligase RtcB
MLGNGLKIRRSGMIVHVYENHRPIKAWTNDIEDEALKQAINIASLPFIHHNGVALMPDVHAGKGSTIGTVIATQHAIIPAAVGVDLGCGMNAVRLSLKASDLPTNLKDIRLGIEKAVPAGNKQHSFSKDIESVYMKNISYLELDSFLQKFPKIGSSDRLHDKSMYQLGTLGSGNHFIELCLDESQDVWIMLHSGSRGIGNVLASFFIERAKKNMERWFIKLPDNDLAYIPEDTEEFKDYITVVNWAQKYAFKNREIMMDAVIAVLKHHIQKPFKITKEAINCHHNYVVKENHFGENLWITRKGAIRAREGDLGIIPGSMGQRSYIVRGKGDKESYCSCSHGAGRKMSRTKARNTFTTDDLIAQTQGVECLKTEAILDEIPSAYKDIEEVMELQTSLVDVVHTLKQVLCIKGA